MTASLRLIRDGEIVVVELSGEIDLSNSRRLADTILAQITNESRALVLDLANVRYLDSAGIAMLFSILKRLEARGQSLALAVPAPSNLRRILEVTRADEAFIVGDGVDDVTERLRRAERVR